MNNGNQFESQSSESEGTSNQKDFSKNRMSLTPPSHLKEEFFYQIKISKIEIDNKEQLMIQMIDISEGIFASKIEN